MLGAWVRSITAAASFAALASCSTGGDDGGPTSSATAAAGGTPTSTGSGGEAVGGAPAGSECCHAELAERLPGDSAKVGRDLCSPQQVEDFHAFCIVGTQELCDDWTADQANQPCEACLLGAADVGPMPALLLSGDTVWVPAFACKAMVADRPECALPLQALVQCVFTACRSCPSGSAIEQACWWYAVDEVCTHTFGVRSPRAHGSRRPGDPPMRWR